MPSRPVAEGDRSTVGKQREIVGLRPARPGIEEHPTPREGSAWWFSPKSARSHMFGLDKKCPRAEREVRGAVILRPTVDLLSGEGSEGSSRPRASLGRFALYGIRPAPWCLQSRLIVPLALADPASPSVIHALHSCDNSPDSFGFRKPRWILASFVRGDGTRLAEDSGEAVLRLLE